MVKQVAIYARVSTGLQSVEMQLRDLRRYADQRGMVIVKEYLDEGHSGTKERRPALDALMGEARKRQFDAVLVWRFDRWARSTRHLIDTLLEFRNLGIEFLSYQENLDTGSPMGAAVFTILAALAQLERDIIVTRVKAGLDNARARGKVLGRPRTTEDARIVALSAQGWSLRRIAKELGTSKSSVGNVLSKNRGGKQG